MKTRGYSLEIILRHGETRTEMKEKKKICLYVKYKSLKLIFCVKWHYMKKYFNNRSVEKKILTQIGVDDDFPLNIYFCYFSDC